MKPFSSNWKRIGTESAFAIGSEITGLVKKGYDIVKLNIGEPSGHIPAASTKAAITSFRKHETHYTPPQGTKSLRKKVAKYISATRGIKYTSDDIVLAPGGKPVIAGTMFILVNPGDEVIYPTPAYPIYESIINYIKAKGIPIQLKEKNEFRFDIKELKNLVSKKTKLLILNSPSNPTGGVLRTDDLKQIATLAKKYDFYILSDEVYSRIAFANSIKAVNFKGNKLPMAKSIVSMPGMAARTVILNGFSKTYGMTGLRLGFACSKIPGFIDEFFTYAVNFWTSLPAPCMAAAETSLGKDQSEAMNEIEKYRKKRDIAVTMLNNIKGIKCHSPKGTFYLFPNVSKAVKNLGLKNAEAFRQYLLSYDKKNKKGVAILARIHFGKKISGEQEEYIRLSVAGKLKDVKEGVRRIKEAVEK